MAAEYMTITRALKDVLWLRTFFSEIVAPQHAREISKTHSDNKGAIALSSNPGFHARSKYVDIQHDFVQQHVNPETGMINLLYCPTDEIKVMNGNLELGRKAFSEL
jgi:hypothetical protein